MIMQMIDAFDWPKGDEGCGLSVPVLSVMLVSQCNQMNPGCK